MINQLSAFDKKMIKRSVELAIINVDKGGEPFGAVLTKGQEVITEAVNEAYIHYDPTAHAEMQAIRQTGKVLSLDQDSDFTMYASGKPCAMCMAAMLNIKISRIVYAADDNLGDDYGWGTASLYDRLKNDFGQQGVEVVYCPDAKSEEAFEAYKDKHQS